MIHTIVLQNSFIEFLINYWTAILASVCFLGIVYDTFHNFLPIFNKKMKEFDEKDKWLDEEFKKLKEKKDIT